MAGDYFELKVSLAPEQAAERISSVLDNESSSIFLIPQGDKALIGKVTGTAFRIRKRKDYANSWSPIFCGRIEPADFGCVIGGKFKLHTLVRAFTILCFGMIVLFLAIGIMMVYIELLKDKFDPKTLLVVLMPIMLIAGYIHLAKRGKRQGKYEAQCIQDILQELFKDALCNT